MIYKKIKAMHYYSEKSFVGVFKLCKNKHSMFWEYVSFSSDDWNNGKVRLEEHGATIDLIDDDVLDRSKQQNLQIPFESGDLA